MTDQETSERSVADEMALLGRQVADAVKSAWESDERKRLQADLAEGVERFGQEVKSAADRFGESETAAELRSRGEKAIEEIRESELVDQIRKGLLQGLDVLNRELGQLLEKLDARKTTAADSEPSETPPEDVGAVG